jgi:bifunctional non-homologous end joining protein LigD
MKKRKNFVVQRHERESEPVHWDLMLEAGDILETYRVGAAPEQWGKGPIEAVKIFDHPLNFLTYQGSVNKGKGRVSIADCGTYTVIKQAKDRLKIEFAGSVLKGEFTLDIVK